MADTSTPTPVSLPRVAITYCTQCKWMLRAGYFGQELLSTFGTSIGEIALMPATGGIFTVHLTYKPTASAEAQRVLLWDRKAEGGFPETKILKQRVRNCIEPEKKLGHSDTPSSKQKAGEGMNGEKGGVDVEGVSSSAGAVSAGSTAGGDGGPSVEKSTADMVRDPLVDGAVAQQECEDCK